MDNDFQKMLQTVATLTQDDGYRILLKALKDRTIRGWAEAKTTEAREAAWYQLQAIGQFENMVSDIPQVARTEKVKVATRKPRNG